MIKFECNNEHLKEALFAGDIETLSAELCMEISLLYGSSAKANEDAAKDFQVGLISILLDHEAGKQIFSTELYDVIASSGAHDIVSGAIPSRDDFEEQLKRLILGEDADDD